MPTPAYMSVEGAKQGPISEGALTAESVGRILQDEHKDEILVQAFSHELRVPTDPQAGQPTGPRVHQPLIITKVYDKSSPKLYLALTTGESLKVKIKWYRTTPEGAQEHYFTHELENAVVVDIKAYMPNCLDLNNGNFMHMEDVAFTYRKITWTHEVASTMGSDDFQKR